MMMDTGDKLDMEAFKTAVNLFYDKVKNKGLNYYELLGIPTTATHRDIENAYQQFSQEFSKEKAAAVLDRDIMKKAQFLIDTGKRAFEVLTDFEKRGLYEKLGFRDVDPQSLVEEDPIEKAREYHKKGKTLYNQKNYKTTIAVMEEAVRLDESRADYFLLLGMAQTQFPDLKRRAEENLKKASEMEAWNAEPLVALGMLFYSERLYKRAEGYFRSALELEPKHAVARKKLEEIVGPEVKFMDKVQNTMGKVFPTLFKKKK